MTIQIRRDTAANWTAGNPTPAAGQLCWETDALKLKVGDGATAWASLAYYGVGGGSGTVTTVSVVTANGVSGSVANATTTPAITLTLGSITPSAVAAVGAVTGSNLSGTNTGDQTSIVGITGTLAEFNAALTGADFATGGGTATGTNTGDQTSVTGNAGTATALATGRTIGMTGDVVWTSPSFDGTANVTAAGTIQTGVVSLSKMADMATASLIYRKTAGTGAPEVQTLATLKTDLGLTGTNGGDQTITLTGDVTGSGTGSFAATIANSAVTNAKMADMVTLTIKGNNTGGAAAPVDLTAAQVKTLLAVASADLSDFNSATRAQVEAELIAGTNITITPASSGATRTLTIAASGGGSGTSTGLAMTLAAASYSM